MSALDVFTYADREVRTVVVDGEPWFVATDVAAILEYRMASDMTRRLEEADKGYAIVRTPGGDQQMTVINESGLYDAVFRSNAAGARPFRRWVTEDVLPTIRKTGRYGSDAAMLAALPSSELLTLAAQAAKRAEEAEARANELEPKAERWDEIASAAGDFSVGDVAKMLCRAGVETGQNRLFKTLDELRWTFWRGGERHAMQAAVDAGLVVERANRPVVNQKTGDLRQVPPQIRVTGKGLDRLAAEFGARLVPSA